MKTSPQVSTGEGKRQTQEKQDEKRASSPSRSLQDEAAPLPHETDQTADSQHEDEPRGVGKQAHRDLAHGLKDTDRRGGDEYQQKTQNDTHSNANSSGHAQRGGHGKR
ncbi:MAG: hypothetical protein WCA85_27895 [Paraburkholderia sp.]|uniref:hypothetical protein n=1 Tax=Paraburkholderia sp. TaxID=1926495 RepID=UPI003C5E924D